MDIQQGYIPVKEEQLHYSEDRTGSFDFNKSSSIPTILPTLVEEEYATPVQQQQQQQQQPPHEASTSSTSSMMEEEEEEEEDDGNSLNPALLLNRYDKRKSSPAILGLPFGLNHEAQLSLHLSQQRNSIEAAMLLANFNKLMAFPKANELEHKGHAQQQQWQDDMSIPSQNKNSWGDVLTTETDANRRHSYDVNMSWQTMSEAFLERPDLLHNVSSQNDPSVATVSTATLATNQNTAINSNSNLHYHHDAPVFKQENFYSNTPTKVSWSHDGNPHQQQPQHPHHPYNVEYPISPRQQHRMYHPTMSSPLTPHGGATANNYHPRYPPPPPPSDPHHPSLMLHPLARQPDTTMKRELIDPQQQHYYSYTFPPQQQQQQQPRYYYPANGKLPLPQGPMDPHAQQHHQQQQQMMMHHPPPILAKPKRKKQKSNSTDDYDEEIVETNEEDYPDMSTRDVEAARSDPEARPRKQKLRFTGDKYTPQWVRYNGQSKEGLCDTCKPGKWLQLKNSAYWYHKQFFHGISSVSGKEFVQPLETRWVDQDLVEGLCHQCHQWVAVSNVKRKNSVLWYRHAHKCHVYHKPKPNVPKKR
ncbi:unnamed protein product [Mucor hiemalis]